MSIKNIFKTLFNILFRLVYSFSNTKEINEITKYNSPTKQIKPNIACFLCFDFP